MRQLSLLAVLAIALSGCTVSVGNKHQDEGPVNVGKTEQQESVLAAARRIANLFDRGQFDEAWTLTGPMLRSQTNQGVFVAGVKGFRSSLGAPGYREVEGFNFPKVIDGVAGDFGLIAIQTDFANAKGVQEKFVFQRVGGEWKLAGYWLSKKVTFGTANHT